MKKLLLVPVILLLIPNIAYAVCSGSSPTWTTTPDYTSVNTCVTGANAGDTINVTSGNATWSSVLTITKRIHLIGSGIGNTNITVNAGSSLNTGLVHYAPTDSFSTDYFRLSGFTFDASTTGYRILYVTRSDMSQPTYIRIDHNRFVGPTVIEIYRRIWGVFHNNTFEGRTHIDNYGGGETAWSSWSPLPGTGENIFYEDNTFTLIDTLTSGGSGGRYVYRYNTIDVSASPSGFYPLWDAHGNQDAGGVYGTMISEIYGNKIIGNKPMRIFDQRGGKAFFYFNKSLNTSNPYGTIRDEYSDSIMAVPSALDSTPQRPNTSYYFNNRYGASGTTLYNPTEGTDVDGLIAVNQNWWNYTPTFNGTTGMGCGTLANRPGTCTVGVGYWATTQDCTTTSDDHVGANPKTPLSGTLYRCTATNTWTAYYTPYTYPHPLRSETDEVAPTATWAIDTTGLIATATFNENVNATTKTGVSFTGSVTGAITATYKDGMPGGIVRYDLNKEVQQGETVVVDYTTPGDGIKDLAGNALADISDGEVTNSSTQNTPPLVTLTIGAHTGATVNVYPGINCGSTCSADYDNGTVLTLSVTTLPNYTGCTIGGTSGCGASTTMNEAKTCTVTCTKIAADNKVGSGNPGHKVGAGNPAHKRY